MTDLEADKDLAVMNYLIDAYTIYAASVLAANSVLRCLFGFAFPLFTSQMYDRLGELRFSAHVRSTTLTVTQRYPLGLICSSLPGVALFAIPLCLLSLRERRAKEQQICEGSR